MRSKLKSIKTKLIIYFLFLSKWGGLFLLSRYLTRKNLRILAYHGFSMQDENKWQPRVFMTAETFKIRMEYLKTKRYPVIKLSSAIDQLSNDKLMNNSIVLTFDDGWYSTISIGHQILQRFQFPYTIYLTSYYSKNNTPIFEMVIKYIFWKTQVHQIRSSILLKIGLPTQMVDPGDLTPILDTLMENIIEYGNSELTNHQRLLLSRQIGKLLKVDRSTIEGTRMLSLLNAKELKLLDSDGVDIQLHSHRHNFPLDKTTALKEIDQNKNYLIPLVNNKLEHFCYPNGDWRHEQLSFLNSAGIKSATTCTPGLNYPETPMYQLKRFVDGENVPQIYFESFISGYTEYLYSIANGIDNIFRWFGKK